METPTLDYSKETTAEEGNAADLNAVKKEIEAYRLKQEFVNSAQEKNEQEERNQLEAEIKEYEHAGVNRRIIMPILQGIAMGVVVFMLVTGNLIN